MTRALLLACLMAFSCARLCFLNAKGSSPRQNQPQSTQKPAATTPAPRQPEDETLPPEDDASVAPKVYPLDPLESDRNIKVGNFYMRQHKPAGYRAAVGRYEIATKYNPSSPEAFFKLGEAEEKLRNKDAARIAFGKVIQLAPDSKFAHEAKKKLGQS